MKHHNTLKEPSSWISGLGAAMILAAARAKDDKQSSLRICDYEKDLQVEFSECDAYNQSRNGK